MELTEALNVFDLCEGASREQVRQAYRDLVKVWHPDRFGSDERLRAKAQEQMKLVNEAYQWLEVNYATSAGAAQSAPRPSTPRKDSSGIFGLVGRGLGTILGAVVQYIGWKKAKFLFWFLIWFLAVRGTVLFVAEWADMGDFSRAIAHFDGFGLWLIPFAVLLLSYVRWVYEGNRDVRKWTVFPAAAIVILCVLGNVGWKALRAAHEYGMAQRERQANAPYTCITELNGYYHCAQGRISPTGFHDSLRQCTEQEIAMAIPAGGAAWAAKPVCWTDQTPPPPPELPAELKQLPTAPWVELIANVPDDQSGASSFMVKLNFCKPAFKCGVVGLHPFVKGPVYFVNQVPLDSYTGSHIMHLKRRYQTLDADEQSAVQAFCQQGLNILGGTRVNDTGPIFSHTAYVPVCEAVPTSPHTSNSLEDTEADPRMRWGMTREQVSQVFRSGDDDRQLEEVGTDALLYRNNSAHFSDHAWYYFKGGKLVETREVQEGGYSDSWYDEVRERLTKKYGQPVPGRVPPNLKSTRSDIFASPRSLIILVSNSEPEDGCGNAIKEECRDLGVSEIFLDRSQAGLAVR